MTAFPVPWRVFAVLLTGMLAFLVTPTSGFAAPPAGAVYNGPMSDGGTIVVTVNADATAVRVVVTYPGPYSTSCSTGVTLPSASIAGTAQAQFASLTASTGVQSNVAIAAYFALPDYQSVVGAYSADPVEGSNCPRRRTTWSAERTPTPEPVAAKVAPSATYAGEAYTTAGVGVGAVQFKTSTDGSMSSASITATSGSCIYLLTVGDTASATPWVRGTYLAKSIATGSVAAVSAPTAVGGSFVAQGSSSACGSLVGMFSATQTSTPPSVAPVTGTGTFVTPPRFGSGSMALVVYGGGSVAQLEAAAKTGEAKGVWAQDASGAFLLFVVNGPAFVNEPFTTKFTAGIAVSTAVTLVR